MEEIEGATNFVSRCDRFKIELSQSLDDVTGALQEIFPNEWSESDELVTTVAILVDYLHLLDDGRLSGLAGTW